MATAAPAEIGAAPTATLRRPRASIVVTGDFRWPIVARAASINQVGTTTDAAVATVAVAIGPLLPRFRSADR